MECPARYTPPYLFGYFSFPKRPPCGGFDSKILQEFKGLYAFAADFRLVRGLLLEYSTTHAGFAMKRIFVPARCYWRESLCHVGCRERGGMASRSAESTRHRPVRSALWLLVIAFWLFSQPVTLCAQDRQWGMHMAAANRAYEHGRYDEAETYLKAALEEVEGDDSRDLDLAVSLNNLAAVYEAQGRYPEAEPFYIRSLAILERVLGPRDPSVGYGLNNLGALYESQGKHVEAEALYMRALEILKGALGPEHVDVAITLNNVALVYNALGKPLEAELLMQQALVIDERHFGPDHPMVATDLNNLGTLYRNQRNYTKAKPLLERSLTIWYNAYGPNHPDVALGLSNLGRLYEAQGAYAEAEKLLRESLAIRELVLGPRHPDTAQSLEDYVKLLRKTNRQAEAAEIEGGARQKERGSFVRRGVYR